MVQITAPAGLAELLLGRTPNLKTATTVLPGASTLFCGDGQILLRFNFSFQLGILYTVYMSSRKLTADPKVCCYICCYAKFF